MTEPTTLQTLLLVDYYPRRQDSHVEIDRPETSFVEFFKQSLIYNSTYCTDPACCSILDDRTLPDAQASINPEPPLNYPLPLFAELQDLPPLPVLRQLVASFCDRVIPSTPFLLSVPTIATRSDTKLFDLLLCKALFGASTSALPEHRQLENQLWHACTSLVTASVSVDNGLGRVIEWLSAATLLVACGTMHSNLERWRLTNAIDGYMMATLFRRDFRFTSLDTSNKALVDSEISKLRRYYFTVDTIKSIHFQTTSMVDPRWSTSVGIDCQYDLKTMTESLILEERPLPPTLSADDHLLILLVLLSSVNTFLRALGPFTSGALFVRQEAGTLSQQMALQQSISSKPTRSHSTMASKTSYAATPANPYVPFTTDRDYSRLSHQLLKAMTMWEKSFQLGDRLQAEISHSEAQSMRCLLHLSRLLLACGPAVYVVPSLAGYTAEPYEALPPLVPRPCAPRQIGIHFGDEAFQKAIEILEVCGSTETGSLGSANIGVPHMVSPIWYPLALFYGALVVWAKMEDEADQGLSRSALLSSRRILHDFYQALKSIETDWECAGRMAEIIQGVIR